MSRLHFTFGATGLAMGRTAVEQAVLGDLPALNSAQHRLFQAGAARATGLAMGHTAVEQAVLGDLPALNSAQHRLFGWLRAGFFQAGAACAFRLRAECRGCILEMECRDGWVAERMF
jgi:hypothetical protein